MKGVNTSMDHIYLSWTPSFLPWLEFNMTTVMMILLTCAIVLVLSIWMTRNLSVENPGKKQVIFEWLYEFIYNTVASTMEMKRGKKFVFLAMTLFLFVLVGNIVGIPLNFNFAFTETNGFWSMLGITDELIAAHDGKAVVSFWMSPTASVSVTVAMSLSIVILSQILGFTTRGPVNHVKHFFQPNPIFLPIHIIEEGTKILTLGFRLFGNIFAKEVLIGVILTMPPLFYYLGGFATMTIWQGFGLFVSAIQAFVFTILSMVYIASQTTHE